MPVSPKYIPDDCRLLRRVSPTHIVPDGNTGKRRLSTGAFRDRQMSVDAECLMAEHGLDASFSLRNHANLFLVAIEAGFARSQQQTVEHTPLDDNPVHAEVIGRKSDPICRNFRDNIVWLRKPADVD